MKLANLRYIFMSKNKCIKVDPICDDQNVFNVGSSWCNLDLFDCMR